MTSSRLLGHATLLASLCLAGATYAQTNTVEIESASHVRPGSEAALIEIRNRAMEDALLKSWLEGLMNGAIKHGLDRGVDMNLRKSPIAAQFYRPVMKEVDEVIYQYRVEQLKTSALAKAGENGQYQDLLKLVQETATRLGFPPEAIKNIHVYVSGQPVVNAYTYSGTTDVIEVVVYEGLLDLMKNDPGALKQVIGHELGHIKSGHIRNRLMLMAIFNATAQDMIPDPNAPEVKAKDQADPHADPKGEEKKAIVEQAIYKQVKLLVDGDPATRKSLARLLGQASGALLMHADAGLQEEMIQAIIKRVEAMTDMIRSTTTAAQRFQLANEMTETIENYAADGTQTPKKADHKPDFKETKNFMAKLDGILSRAQEISSDRYGFLAVGGHLPDAITAYVRLVGGKGATVAGMLAQQEELDKLLLNNPEAQKEEGTHPTPAERVQQFQEFAKHPGFLIYNDSYLQAIYEYLSLSQLIFQNDQIIGNDMLDLTGLQQARWKREAAVAFGQELSGWIESRVLSELNTAAQSGIPTKASYVNFKGLLDLMQSFTAGGRGIKLEGRLFQDWQKALGQKNGLVYNVVMGIEQMKTRFPNGTPSGEMLTKASEALKAVAPGFEGLKRASETFESGLAGTFKKEMATTCEAPLAKQ